MLITNRAQKYGAFAGAAFIAAGFAVGAAGPGQSVSLGTRVGGSLVAIFAGCWAVRCLRVGVELSDLAVTLRNFFSTRLLSWSQIREITVVDSGNSTGRATCVAFLLDTGELVRAQATASFRRAKVVKMKASIERARPTPTTQNSAR